VIIGVLLAFLLGWVLVKLSKIVPGSLDQLFDWMYQHGESLVQTVIGPSLPNLQAFSGWSAVGLMVAFAIVVVAGLLPMRDCTMSRSCCPEAGCVGGHHTLNNLRG
jgi:hypothetical protein